MVHLMPHWDFARPRTVEYCLSELFVKNLTPEGLTKLHTKQDLGSTQKNQRK